MTNTCFQLYFHMNSRFESAMSYHVWRHAEMIFSITKPTARVESIRDGSLNVYLLQYCHWLVVSNILYFP